MRSQEELERLWGGPEGVRRVMEHVKAVNDGMPPLSQRQKDALRILLGSGRIPPRPPKRDQPPETAAAAPLSRTAA